MHLGRVQHHPGEDGDCLAHDVLGRAEKPRSLLGQTPECVVAEGSVQLCVTTVELGRRFAWFPGRHSGPDVLDLGVASFVPAARHVSALLDSNCGASDTSAMDV